MLTLEQFLLMRNTAGFGPTQAWVHISAPPLASESWFSKCRQHSLLSRVLVRAELRGT